MKRRITFTIFFILFSVAGLVSCAKSEKPEEYVYPTETYDTPPTATVDHFDGKVNGLTLMENTVYYATDAGLFRFDEEAGAGVALVDKPVDFVEKHRGALLAVSLAERCVYRIENDTAEAVLTDLDERITPDDVFGFAVCDDSFVFLCRDAEQISGGTIALFMINRESGEMRIAPVVSTVSKVFPYERNRVFLYNYGRSSDACYFAVYDTESEQEEERIPISQMGVSDAEYCPYIDSLLIYTRDDITRKMTLKQLDLSDQITRTLISYGDAAAPNVKGLIAAETNIVCCGLTDSGTLRYFNLNEEHPLVTVAVYGYPQASLQVLMSLFKEKHEIDVNVMQFDYGEADKLNTKLLAQDGDIDVYYTLGLTPAYYILRNAYCDLGQFDALAGNLSRCAPLIEAAASNNGEIFGVPTEFGIIDSAAEDNPYNNSFYQYMATQIDLTKKEFRDEDGEALKILYQHYLAYPDDDGPAPPWGEFRMVWCSYMIMNPASRHKEEAALFLNDLLSLYLGDFDGEAASFPLMQLVTKYPENADYDDVFIQWKFTDMNVFNMI
ncbi:MAG: hypothetical protein IKX19_09125, partial [Clostridia bacterium]|nr:hypothetical protein [Clostridia bacterium]